MILISLSILLILLSAPLCSAETIDNTPISELDLERYMGKWHEVARFDNRFERNLTNVTAEYSFNDENLILVVNRGFNTEELEWQEAHGRGETTPMQGRLKISFFLFFASEYNVMGIGENYEWALVGTKSSKYLWILSRTPSLPLDTLTHIITLAENRGYNIKKLNIIQREEVARR